MIDRPLRPLLILAALLFALPGCATLDGNATTQVPDLSAPDTDELPETSEPRERPPWDRGL